MAVSPATALAATTGLYKITLTWTASATPNVSYIVYRAAGDACFSSIATVAATSYTDYNVMNGVGYAYYVVATNGTTQSTPTDTKAVTYTGPDSQYRDPPTREERVLAAGTAVAGGGEAARIARLKASLAYCGK